MSAILDFLAEHFLALQVLALLWVLGSFGFMHVRNRRSGRYFDPPKTQLLHDETFASGRSMSSFFTRMGGARNCLKIMLTTDCLYVRPFFPFQILGARFDLLHRIPLEKIVSVRHGHRFMLESLAIRYRTEQEGEKEIELYSKSPRELRAALAVAMGQATNPGAAAGVPPPLPTSGVT